MERGGGLGVAAVTRDCDGQPWERKQTVHSSPLRQPSVSRGFTSPHALLPRLGWGPSLCPTAPSGHLCHSPGPLQADWPILFPLPTGLEVPGHLRPPLASHQALLLRSFFSRYRKTPYSLDDLCPLTGREGQAPHLGRWVRCMVTREPQPVGSRL